MHYRLYAKIMVLLCIELHSARTTVSVIMFGFSYGLQVMTTERSEGDCCKGVDGEADG